MSDPRSRPLPLPARPSFLSLAFSQQVVSIGLALLVLLALLPALIDPARAAGLSELNGRTLRRVLVRPATLEQAAQRLEAFYGFTLAQGSEGGRRVTTAVLVAQAVLLGVVAYGATQVPGGGAVQQAGGAGVVRLAGAGSLRARAALAEPEEGRPR